jgi:hypothetical protein
MTTFVLVHSPLVGPYTWQPLAEELRHMGYSAVVPRLSNVEMDPRRYWKQHVDAVAEAARGEDPEQIVLVGHSGAGVLLPAISQALGGVAGYVFVDADLPTNGLHRLDRFPMEQAEHFRQAARGGYIPPWTEEDLAEVIPDPEVRHRFVSELRPTPLAVYEEPIPVFEGWPDAPAGYLSFSLTGAYVDAIRAAQRRGWPFIEVEGYHFHMLVDPPEVARSLVRIVEHSA